MGGGAVSATAHYDKSFSFFFSKKNCFLALLFRPLTIRPAGEYRSTS
jgi:hypothetical protein